MEFHELPLSWQAKIRKIRRENARYRMERVALRAELAQLQERLAQS
ncbi:hypothetical protein [Mycolicibacterium smegmatis]|uniref:Uncharacterized protein n=1 Tax=Mycolicibacterium smegmatis (strain MKD8) TaxID=1214915 RepID=A0A2U9PQ04_MYCSE|nr:hypothetical protein [Mycolicibacterium smegmatis]AWT53850.1 hypothetical protein D806_028760 [Mycolicibacterium smegmatis MKD8]